MRLCIFGDAHAIHLKRAAAAFAARGATVHVVTGKVADVPGATVERFSVPAASLRNPRRWASRWRHYLTRFVREFDIVALYFLHDWGFDAEILDQGCVVVAPWGSDITPPPGEESADEELRASRIELIRHAALVHAWGPWFAGEVARLAGLHRSEVKVLCPGVDLSLFDLDRFPAGPREARPPTVGFFKGFRAVYGPKSLMAAIPSVRQVVPDVRFEMIGDGPELAVCKEMAVPGAFAECCVWHPPQPQDQLPSFLARWDLTVIPSVCESFGIAALEASAMRVPVVASRIGGLVDAVADGETGLLVPQGDTAALASAVVRLLKERDLRSAMGAAGRARVLAEFDWTQRSQEWYEAYARAREKRCVMV
ncbi:MAG: glycosyltransferase family 4 protein [Phycisphaerae bacterium]|nr:glycosyltransferase family 4 protein [Phycisphaerae bacterium]